MGEPKDAKPIETDIQMDNNKLRVFNIHFKGKAKHDTRYFSASERVLVESGLTMIEMNWPGEEQVKVVEKSNYDNLLVERDELKSRIEDLESAIKAEDQKGVNPELFKTYGPIEVVAAILTIAPPSVSSVIKIKKLLYFAHSWCLALSGRPLLNEGFIAGEYGPEIPRFEDTLCDLVAKSNSGLPLGTTHSIGDSSLSLIKKVVEKYGPLSDLTLSEMALSGSGNLPSPWKIGFACGVNSPIMNKDIELVFKDLINTASDEN